MRAVRAAGDAENRAAGVHVPIRRAQPREGRDDHDAARVRHPGREVVDGRGGRDQPHLVAQPLDRAAAVEDAALEGVGRLAADAPRDGRHQPRTAAHGPLPDVHQGEAARAVGILRLAGAEAALPEEGGLLVARRAADRDARELFKPRDAGLHAAVDLAV